MTPHRLLRYRVLAGACVLFAAGLSPAVAQFLPGPGQSARSGQFPPAPGAQGQDPAFPPAPGQAQASPQRQDPAFPPAPAPGRMSAPGSFVSSPNAGGGGFGGAPASGGFSAPPPGGGFGGGQQQVPEAQKVCLTFPAIRADVEKEFGLIKAAGERKAGREEACGLFKSAVLKETKMLKFLEANRSVCGVPVQAINQVKANHVNTIRIRNQVCSNAPTGPAPGPSLSDALGAPLVADDTDAKKPGRGTFDTLTGNVLSR
jgi:hypothetical protein